ncbi:MAG: DUF503 domain-containing protein [Planctomycetes bacterium]|nr:DUF503 domain-containing protein [Planctomycetota bacterium]
MFVGALRVEFLVPEAHSLKDKRKPLRSLKDRLRSRFKVAVAEVDAQDLQQRVVIGVALVAPDEKNLHEQMDAIKRYLEKDPELQLHKMQERVGGNFSKAAGIWQMPEDMIEDVD